MENKPGSKEEDLEKMKKIWRRRMQEMENSGEEEEPELEEDGECRNSSLKDLSFTWIFYSTLAYHHLQLDS